jgi:chromosome segregation ATPase
MSLNNAPKDIVSTTQVLLSVAEAIQYLDPKKLKELIEIANKLPPEEAARAEKARKDIADNQKTLSDNRKVLEQIEAKQAEVVGNLATLESTRNRLNDQASALGIREKELDEGFNKLRSDQILLEEQRKSVEKDRLANEVKSQQLNVRAKSLDEVEETLKNKEKKLLAIMEG